ncbi:MAG: hypothetical protein HPY69_06530 [Armatimonadetes bacterium]|nr:hypothetical protein [Armatimonadota bacterium]
MRKLLTMLGLVAALATPLVLGGCPSGGKSGASGKEQGITVKESRSRGPVKPGGGSDQGQGANQSRPGGAQGR